MQFYGPTCLINKFAIFVHTSRLETPLISLLFLQNSINLIFFEPNTESMFDVAFVLLSSALVWACFSSQSCISSRDLEFN